MDSRYHPTGTVGTRTCESCGERQPATLAALVEAEHGEFVCCPSCRPEWFG